MTIPYGPIIILFVSGVFILGIFYAYMSNRINRHLKVLKNGYTKDQDKSRECGEGAPDRHGNKTPVEVGPEAKDMLEAIKKEYEVPEEEEEMIPEEKVESIYSKYKLPGLKYD